MDLCNDFIELNGFGKVYLADLLSITKGENNFWSVLSDRITLKELNDGARRLHEIVTPDNHKFTLVFWKEILKWQETVPGPEMKHFIFMLGHTIQLYLSWDLNDQNVFKILRYLASGFHKLVKLRDDQEAIVGLLYKLHQTGGERNVTTFLLLFKTSMERLVKPRDSESLDPDSSTPDPLKYHVIQLIQTLETVSCQTMEEVFDKLDRVEICSAISAGFTLYWEARADRPMSLIHRFIYKLSSLCTLIRDNEELKVVECVLVTNLLSYNYLQSAVSTNVLVFLARLAPGNYVTQLVNCLSDLVTITRCQIRSSSLKLAISRLLPVMDQSESIHLQSKFARLDGGLLQFLGNDQKKEEITSSTLQLWKSSKIKTGDLLKVLPVCQKSLPTLTELSDLLLDLPMCRNNRDKLDNVYFLVVCCLERLRDNWREYRDDASSVIQLFQLLHRLLSLNDLYISTLILDVVSKFSSYSTPDPTMFCQLSNQIFSKLMKCKRNPYLERKCLFVIATYAKMTPYPKLLSNLAQDPDIKSKLTNFFQHKERPSDMITNTMASTEMTSGSSSKFDGESILDVIKTTPGRRLILHAAIEEIQTHPKIPIYARQLLSASTLST